MPTNVKNRLQTIARVRAVDKDAATVEVVASTGDVARDHAIIEVAGWELDQYMKNPVVLWAHNDYEVPIARAIDATKDTDADELRIKVEFDVEDPESARIFGKVVRGFVNAVSVRWIPFETETREIDDYGQVLVFVRQELLELSFCSVPADPGALVMRSEGRSVVGEPVTPETFCADDFEGCAAKIQSADLDDDHEEVDKVHPEASGQQVCPDDDREGHEDEDEEHVHDPMEYINDAREALAGAHEHIAGLQDSLAQVAAELDALEHPPDDEDEEEHSADDDDHVTADTPIVDEEEVPADFDWDAYRDAVEAQEVEAEGSEAEARGAIAVHHTPVETASDWDGGAAVAQAPSDAAVLRYMHAWSSDDEDADPDEKGSYKFPHHPPKRGSAANINGVNNAKARLPNSDIPNADKAGVLRHLEAHQDDAEEEEAASLASESEAGYNEGDSGGTEGSSPGRPEVDEGRASELLARLVKLTGTSDDGDGAARLDGPAADDETRALAARVAAVLEVGEDEVAQELAGLSAERRTLVSRILGLLERRPDGALAGALRDAVARTVAEGTGRDPAEVRAKLGD